MRLNLSEIPFLFVGFFLLVLGNNIFAVGIGGGGHSPPSVAVTYPTNGTVVTDQVITVTGAAHSEDGFASMQPWVENSLGKNYYQVSGQNPWSFQATLMGGYNNIGIHVESGGLYVGTADSSVKIYYKQLLPLSLSINGSGTVTPDLTGNLLEVTQNYQVTAQPGAGYVFAGWTGSVAAQSRTLDFTMASNTVLQANFIPSPFIQSSGNYNGVVVPRFIAQLKAVKLSGLLNLTLGGDGAFTANVRLGNHVFPFSGFFSANGSFYSDWLTSKSKERIAVELHLDTASGALNGTLVNQNGSSAQLFATKPIYNLETNPAPQAGKYTLLIAGSEDSAMPPGGDGYAVLSVDGSGNVEVSGKLSDGTPFTEKTFVSDGGKCPIAASVYSGNGSISGWLTFTNGDTSDIVGTLVQMKGWNVRKGIYPWGFEIQSKVVGSSYDSRNLTFTGGLLMLTNGGLPDPIVITGNPSIISQDKSKNQKVPGVSLKVTPATGTFSGSVRGFPVSGIILQRQNFGGGFFLGADESGRVYLGP